MTCILKVLNYIIITLPHLFVSCCVELEGFFFVKVFLILAGLLGGYDVKYLDPKQTL